MFRKLTHFVVAFALIFVVAGCQAMTGETAGEHISDTGITTQVKSRLAADRLGNVSVETVRKTVYLTGVVNSADEKRRAGESARTAEGVKEVVNNLQVRAQ